MTAGVKACSRCVALVMAAILSAVALSCVAWEGNAYADDSFTVSINSVDCPDTLHIGDTFTVTQNIAKEGEPTFPMYALSTMVSYDPGALELVSCEPSNEKGDVNASGGSIIYNTFSRVLAGYVMESGAPLYAATFKVVGEGSTSISVTRVNMTNYTGMHSMPSVAYGLTVHADGGQAVVPEASQSGSSAGTATEEDKRLSGTSGMVDAVTKSPAIILDPENKLSPETLKGLYDAGMTKESLVALGFLESEIDRVEQGETVAISNADSMKAKSGMTAGANDAADDDKASDGLPILPIAAGVICIAVLTAGVIVFMRSRK